MQRRTFTSHALALGAEIHARHSRSTDARSETLVESARRTFELVKRVNPRFYEEQSELAAAQQGRGEYLAAHKSMTALVAALGRPAPSSEQFRQWIPANITLARVSTVWGQSLLTSGAATDADAHLIEALEVLDLIDPMIPAAQSRLTFDSRYIRCNAEFLRGKLAISSQPDDAKRHLLRSRAILESFKKDFPSKDRVARTALENQVDECLRTVLSRLSVPRNETGFHPGA